MNQLILLALTAGAVLPIQAALNARLGKELGNPTMATLASFMVGGIALLIFLLAIRSPFPTLATLGRVPVFLWIGGVLGGIYVALVVMLTPKLGVAATMGLVVGGQIGISVLLDHYGLLGLNHHPLNLWRVVGLGLLVAGVVLVKRF